MSNLLSTMRTTAVRATSFLPIFFLLLQAQTIAQPTVGGFSTPLGYIERSAPLAVAGGITLASGNDYSDGYVEFVVTSGTSSDVLGYITASTPSTSMNVVTIVGTTIYRGNGSIAKIIGAVDQTFNGRNGQKLRINFSAALENAQFNEGVNNGLLPGWTITNSVITNQSFFPRTQARALTISGANPYTVTRRINQTTPGSTSGTIEYQFQTDFNYNPNLRSWWGYEGEYRGGNVTLTTSVVNDPLRSNNQALMLKSSGSVPSPNTNAYGSIFGPMVVSSNFQAFQGDQLTLEWYARRISDDYEVYGYIEEVNTNVRTLLFYGRGANQPWTTVSGTIPATGTYRFRFINGTYDQTGGFVVGSELYIDNIRIISAETTDDAIAQAVARLVTYEHTSCTPPASRTLTVNARTAAGQIGTASNTINITEINCAPTYSATVLANRTHTSGGSATSLFSASNASTQEANQTFVEWRLTYSGFVDGANEVLRFDGTDIPLVNGSGTTATNAIAYTVLNGVITFTKAGGVTPAVLNTALVAMTYNSLGALTPGARTVSLSYLKDDGGTANSGVDEATFAASVATSTINVLELSASVTTLPLITRCTPSASTEQSFTVSGANLQGNVSVTAPASFEVSLSSGTGFASSVAITASGTLSPRTVYVRLTSAATGTPAGNVTIASTGATSQSVAVSGSVAATNANLSITNSLCGNQSLLWATWNSVNASGGTGTFGNLGVTVSVSHSRGGLSTTPTMFSHNVFPSQYTVPNTVSLRNDLSGVFTFTFSQPITNPQVAFSSIGNPGTSVGINTSVPYAVVWNGQNVVYNTPTRFTGNEGNTIVSFPGTHQTITLEYLADETYANLAFGFENFNCTAPQICPGDAVTLTASGGAAYAWSPATGLNITNAAQVIASPTVTTTYTVTDPNNPCATPRNITINVSQIPTAPTATATQFICPGATVATLAATVGTGQSLRWYAAAAGGTALAGSTALVMGTTYYAEAVDLTCGPSPTRTAVTVQRFPDLVAASVGTAMLIRGTPIVIDSMLVINETNTINGALVFISSGFASGDVLAYNGTLPSGVNRSYNPSTGVLTFTGNITPADLQATLRQVTINTTSTVAGLRSVTFNIGSALPFSTNGHFYEFVTSAGISWTAAKAAAQGRSLYGRQGYLVTVTSAAENQFVASKLAGQGWLGATDEAVENAWRWDTGPEAGQQFWSGRGSNVGGVPVNNLYNNWAFGEPNDAGGEDYAHFLSNGTWNDYPLQLSNISGYVVEYGGMPNDACAALSSSKSVDVTTSFPPSVTTSSPIGVFTDVTASISGQVTSDGDAALTERGFVIGLATSPTTTPATGGFKLVNPTSTVGSYSGTFTGLAPNTLYFARAYAINARGTSYGNEISFTTAPVQPAAITTDRNDATFGGAIICSGTSITLTSSVTTGTIEWLADNCTGTVLGTGNSITVSPTTTTTYFARTFNSATGLRSSCAQVPVTVQAAAPTITYAAPYYLYYSGEAIATNAISVSGSGAQAYVASYSISPALPAGLNFNTATAAITGTAVNGNTRTSYTVTGITPCGNVTTTVAIEVLQCAGFVAADFALRGNATFNAGASEFVLTTATGNQFGATWNQTRLDLTQDFDINSQIFLGTNDGGADGIAFVLQPLSLNQGSSGGGLGYAGINPSVAVEFDTWNNGSYEPGADHAAFMINGNTTDHTTGSYAFPVNIEDGQYRPARFKWEAATKTFRVFVSGTQILTKTNWDIVATVFNNNPNVYWGFTGATGGAVNLQKVKFDRYCLTVANNTVADLTTVSPIGTLTNSTAAIAGEVVSDGGSEVTERGFVLSTATAPTTANTRIVSTGTGVGLINGTFTGLQPATLYYARSYAVNSIGTGYGNEISFYTRPADVTGVTSSDFNTTHQANVICFGASTTLTAAGVSGAVHWYTASCGGTQVGVGATLLVSPTVTTTYFARNFNNNLFSDGCAQITVVVRPQIVPQTISGAETICWNSRPVGFTGTAVTGGTGPWTYQWQQREFLNGVWGAWTNIAQATNFAAYRPDFMFTTTEFRLLATDTGSPACSTNASSNVITVTVRDPFTPSVISVNNGAYAFCENDQLTLTATPTLGGSGPPFQYQWQQSADSINWVNVGPAQNNQINLVVSNLSADTYYRLIAFDLGTPGCGSVFSINGFKVFVQPTVLAGGISGSQHICAQTAPAAITSTNPGAGRGTLSYRWESSQNGGTSWNTIAGANAVSYQPGVLTTTTDFRRYTISTFQGAACESPLAADSTIRILVDSLPIAQVFGQLRDTACVNAPYQLMGGYSSNGTRAWSHNGVGSLSSATALQPIYTPVAADAGNVVQFTMVVTGSQICGLTTDTARFDLLIDSLPYAIAGVADTICSNGSYQVVGASAAYGTVQWSHNGAGTLQQANTLTPTYVAAAGDEGNRVRLILSVTSNNTCVGLVDRDTVFVSVDPLPVAVAGGSNIICAGTSSQISGASAQHGTILWTIDAASGRGTILNDTTLTPTYVADTLDAGSTVRLKMTVTSTNTCNPQTAVAYFDVVVRPNFVSARLVNQNQELCYNTSARVITAQPAVGGTGPYGYQWQISADSTTWTNIAGAVNLTYTQPGIMSATRYYRILSTDLGNPVCGTIVSSTTVAKITVFEPLTPPLFASNQITVCNGTSAVILPQPARGGRNDFRYQWQQSANGTTGWVNVGPPSQSLQFSSPALTSGTYYRVIGRDEDFPNGDPSCGSVFSNAVRIIVADPAVAGAITGTQTICLGSTAAVIQSQAPGTGSGTVSYAWEANAGQGWSRIAGATLATYNAGALTTTTQFRRFTVATLNGVACESVASNAVTITVDNPAQFTAASQGDTTLMALASVCSASAFNYQVAATAPSAITFTYSMSGATVDTGAGTGSGRVFNVGVTAVRVYAATNCAVSVHAFDVTVNDTVRPTIVAQNITVNLDANGQAVITPAMVDNGSSDNCSIASSTLSATSFTCANVGANQVTFTVTDVNGNVSQANVVVTVVDAILPTVVAQPLTVFLNAAGQASITAAMVDNGSSDNCGIATRSLSQTNFSCSNVGANNITFTVTDVNGNTNQAVAVITVRDTLKPIVLARNLTVALNASGQANITAAMVDSGSTDNCAIATRALTMSSFSCANVGANNVTLTVTDVNGNAQTATVVVTVIDTVRPTIVAQNITVNLDANGQAVITPAMVDNGSSDNCSIASRTLNVSSFSCANVGANPVTFTVTDVNGNVSQANVVVTVVDADTPIVRVQNRTVFLDANGAGQLTAAQIDAGSSDNCAIAQLQLSQTQFGCADVGTNVLTLTVTDVHGNVGVNRVNVVVADTIAPIVTRFATDTLYVTRDACAALYYWRDSISVFDACGSFTVQSAWPNVILLNKGQHQLNFTVTDIFGNARAYSRPVVVIDTIRPTILNVPVNVTIYAGANCGRTYTWVPPTPSDNCTGITMTSNFNSGDFFPLGTTQVQYFVTDAVGLMNQASFTITVVDTTPPSILAQNLTVNLDANGQAVITPAMVDNGSSDNCGIASRTLSATSFTCANVGANQVTFTVTDVNGNVRQATVVVTVVDTLRPIVVAQNLTVNLGANGQASITAAMVSNGSADNCSIANLSLSQTNFDCSHVGANNVTLTVTDVNGNTNQAVAVITVRDTLKPIVLARNLTVALNASGQASITAAMVDSGSTDNCAIATRILDLSSFSCANVGANNVTLTVTDVNGNVSQATVVVTVLDTLKPIVLAQNLTVALDANGQSNITVGMVNTGTSDNCGIATLALSRTNFNCTLVGANNVIFTATDVHGNISQATVVVTVVDNFPPVARTRNLTAYLGINGLVNITAAMVDSGSSDNCGIASMTISKTSFNCSNTGLNNVTFSVIDLYGNTALRTVTVNVLDTIKPVIQLAADTITAYLGSNQCLASVSLTGIQVTDNCGAPTVVISPGSGAAFSVGITPVSITATDASGNQRQRVLYVRVLDTIAPVIVGMPTTVTMAYDSLQCGAVVSWAQPVAIDNCATGLSSNLVSGTFFGVGSHTVIYTATDPSGNSTQRSIQFTVNDVFAPRWTSVPASITLIAASNSCSAVASWTTPTATDNCSSVTMGGSHTSGSTFPVGITTVVLTATDAAGNVANHSFTVTVRDTIAPTVVSMPGNAVLGICQATFNYPAPTATDACGTVTISQISGLASGSVFPLGTTTNVFRFTDASGNTVTASFTVTVQSTSLPFVPVNLSFCSNDTVQDLSRGYTGYVFFGNGISNGIFFNPAQAVVGNQAIDFTFTDSIGCSTSGRIIISVSPSPLKPVIERVNATTLRARDVYDAYQWYRYDQPIFGATQQSYVVSVSGVYTLKVSNNFGCEVFSDPFGFGVGINVEELGKDGFNIYPNPNKGRFFVHHAFDDLQTRTILVLDMLGKVVYQQESNTAVTELDLAHLAQGRYFVRIESEKELGIKSVIIRY